MNHNWFNGYIESLVVLKLSLCWDTSRFEFPLSMCLPHLKVLHLEAIRFPNDGSEERLFSSCPVLEELVLRGGNFGSYCTEFKVSNQNIKTLEIQDFFASEGEDIRILINAPSLESPPSLVLLDYTTSLDHSIVLEDAKSLPEAIIYPPVDYEPGLGEKQNGALREIQNVQTLKLDYRILRDLKSYGLPIPLFEKMTCLKLQGWQFLFDPICLEYFLACCVVIETLVLEESSSYSTIEFSTNQYSLRKSRWAPLLRHLKTIEIQLHDIVQAKTLMKLIAFFLKNARVLEKLNIHAKQALSRTTSEDHEKDNKFSKSLKEM